MLQTIVETPFSGHPWQQVPLSRMLVGDGWGNSRDERRMGLGLKIDFPELLPKG